MLRVSVLFLMLVFLFSCTHISKSKRDPAAYKGEISFTQAEIEKHALEASFMQDVGMTCLMQHEYVHTEFYKNHCVGRGKDKRCLSKYFGNRRYSKNPDKNERVRADGRALTYLHGAVMKAGFPFEWADKMESISCVDLALKCLGQGFKFTDQEVQWDKILKYTVENGTGGTALQHALQQIGWKVYYWNPYSDPKDPELTKWVDMEKGDPAPEGTEEGERVCGRFKRAAVLHKGVVKCPWESYGYHDYGLAIAKRKKRYLYNDLDDVSALVGFGKSTPPLLTQTRFWIGTANGGYHVFPEQSRKLWRPIVQGLLHRKIILSSVTLILWIKIIKIKQIVEVRNTLHTKNIFLE